MSQSSISFAKGALPRTENERAAVAVIEGILNRDAELLRKHLASDAVFQLPLPAFEGKAIRGLDNIVPVFSTMRASNYTNAQGKIFSIVSSGDRVIIEWIVSSTVKATGAAYKSWYCFSYRLEHGKVAEALQYADTAYGRDMLGEGPTKAVEGVIGNR